MDSCDEWPLFTTPSSPAPLPCWAVATGDLDALQLSAMTVVTVDTSARTEGRDDGWKNKKYLHMWSRALKGSPTHRTSQADTLGKKKLILLDTEENWENWQNWLTVVISWTRKEAMIQSGLSYSIIFRYAVSLSKTLFHLPSNVFWILWFTAQSFYLFLASTSYCSILYWRVYHSTEMLIPKWTFQSAFTTCNIILLITSHAIFRVCVCYPTSSVNMCY